LDVQIPDLIDVTIVALTARGAYGRRSKAPMLKYPPENDDDLAIMTAASSRRTLFYTCGIL